MWDGFCEQLKECGRSGTLFVAAMVVVFAAAPFGAGGLVAMGALLLIFLTRICVGIARAQGRFEKLGKLPPLSQNEWKTARSKLLGQKNAK